MTSQPESKPAEEAPTREADTNEAPEPRSVAIALQKGGVGKTTIAINVPERLSARGYDVLLVDLDQQGNATSATGLDKHYTTDEHLGTVLRDSDRSATELIQESDWGFDVLPAHRDLDEVKQYVSQATMGHTLIQDRIVDPLLGTEYDFIIFDVPPDINPLSDAGLYAAGNVIIPLKMSEPSVHGFHRMREQQIGPLMQGRDFSVLAIVPNELQSRFGLDNNETNILTELAEADLPAPFPEEQTGRDLLPSFALPDSDKPGLRKREAFRDSYAARQPLAEYDPDNDQIERLDELADIIVNGGPTDGR